MYVYINLITLRSLCEIDWRRIVCGFPHSKLKCALVWASFVILCFEVGWIIVDIAERHQLSRYQATHVTKYIYIFLYTSQLSNIYVSARNNNCH